MFGFIFHFILNQLSNFIRALKIRCRMKEREFKKKKKKRRKKEKKKDI